MRVAILGSPPPSLQRALKAAGANVCSSDVCCSLVCSSRFSRTIEGPWLWLPPSAPKYEAEVAAVSSGCVDVVHDGDVERVLKRVRVLAAAAASPPVPDHPGVIAVSAASQKLLRRIFQASTTSQPVLLTGETGTGKDVAAHLIHSWSRRREHALVPLNCAAIPNELMEAELFGYAKGAFSGAVKEFEGQISAAAGGSVFLDEIDDTPLPLQVKLLRVLEDHVVTRLGETEQRRVDFRLLAATNRDLRALVKSGEFGADLYERLAIVRIEMPPLRERLEDLPALVELLLARFREEEGASASSSSVRVLSPSALRALQAYPWPGNIRELRNVVFESLVYKRGGDELLLSDLPRRILKPTASDGPVDDLAGRISRGGFDLKKEKEALEKRALQEALRLGGSAAAAARLLGTVGRGDARDPADTVRAMLRRHGLE